MKPMNAISFMLFAEHGRGETFRERFSSRGSAGHDDVLLGLLIVATIVACMWAISRLVSLRRQRRGYSSPWRLFRSLCQAHRLNWSDSWLLRRVARSQGLQEPARLFLEGQFWEERNLGPRFALEYPRLRSLRIQILGESTRSSSLEFVVRPTQSAAPPATPLFPNLPSPTLDVPPWTVER
jgi:hypothetical protein